MDRYGWIDRKLDTDLQQEDIMSIQERTKFQNP